MKTKTYSPKELEEKFNDLDSVELKAMTGKWKGGFYKTGNIFEKLLWKWWGKDLTNNNKVEALIYNFFGLKFNIPWFGSAVLKETQHKGEKTVAIFYKNLPVVDYLKKTGDGKVMGVFEFKGKPKVYFWLEKA